MKFRTEIELPAQPVHLISHGSRLLMLGSCFTDNIGQQLELDGFDVVHNPMGPLYNPVSILHALSLALQPESHTPRYVSHEGIWHCLDFASRYSAPDPDDLRNTVDAALAALRERILESDTVIITLGTAFVFSIGEDVVGNCHKLPPSVFTRRMLSFEECSHAISDIVTLLDGKTVIFTISPIRHVADTLHGNQLSKATLMTALHDVTGRYPGLLYFPAYEILLDDLRDYRFYAADLKHPSDTAIQYIYEIFARFFFNVQTIEKARVQRKQSKRMAHIPIKHATQSF